MKAKEEWRRRSKQRRKTLAFAANQQLFFSSQRKSPMESTLAQRDIARFTIAFIISLSNLLSPPRNIAKFQSGEREREREEPQIEIDRVDRIDGIEGKRDARYRTHASDYPNDQSS